MESPGRILILLGTSLLIVGALILLVGWGCRWAGYREILRCGGSILRSMRRWQPL